MIQLLIILNCLLILPFYACMLIVQAIFYLPILFLIKDKTTKKYLINNFLATDQGTNAACGGDPDETISSRIGKDENSNIVAKWVSKFLDLFQKDHAKISEEPDEGKDKIV